jgi:hypothetical protein
MVNVDAVKHLQDIIPSQVVCSNLMKPTEIVPLHANLDRSQVTFILDSVLEKCSLPSVQIDPKLLCKKEIKCCILSLHPSIRVGFEPVNASHFSLVQSLVATFKA